MRDSRIPESKILEVYDSGSSYIKNNNTDSEIFTIFLNNQCDSYMENTCDKRKVIDFIAGMTDDYFIDKVDAICGNY